MTRIAIFSDLHLGSNWCSAADRDNFVAALNAIGTPDLLVMDGDTWDSWDVEIGGTVCF